MLIDQNARYERKNKNINKFFLKIGQYWSIGYDTKNRNL